MQEQPIVTCQHCTTIPSRWLGWERKPWRLVATTDDREHIELHSRKPDDDDMAEFLRRVQAFARRPTNAR